MIVEELIKELQGIDKSVPVTLELHSAIDDSSIIQDIDSVVYEHDTDGELKEIHILSSVHDLVLDV